MTRRSTPAQLAARLQGYYLRGTLTLAELGVLWEPLRRTHPPEPLRNHERGCRASPCTCGRGSAPLSLHHERCGARLCLCSYLRWERRNLVCATR